MMKGDYKMKTLKQKWQIAKDYGLFGDALAANGTLTQNRWRRLTSS